MSESVLQTIIGVSVILGTLAFFLYVALFGPRPPEEKR